MSAPASGPVPDLSIFIIARDEADRIGRTIAAVRDLSDDIVLVDSGSQDDTVAIAEALGARVLHNDWPGYGPQKRFAEDQCRHNWLLNIDADEVAPPDLVEEIRRSLAGGAPGIDGFRIRIAEIFPGEERPHPLAYAWPRSGSTAATGVAMSTASCTTASPLRASRHSLA